MNKMPSKLFTRAIALVIFLLGTHSLGWGEPQPLQVQAEIVDVGNAICPISGKAVNPKAAAVYEGKRYAFCCQNCVAKFEKDPEKYVAEATA